MHEASEFLRVLERRGWQYAVAEIEDMPGASSSTLEHIASSRQHAINRSEQKRGIEIALHAASWHPRPGFVERLAPIETDHVSARFGEVTENRCRADAKVDHGHAATLDPIED